MKTCKEMAKLWGVTERTVTTFCKTGKIPGAVKEGKSWFLRVFIDKEGGIDIEECAFVSEKLSEKLDAADPDPIPQAYFLEVSSPGAERPLKKESDYEKALGDYVHVSLYQPVDGEKQYEGFLQSFDAEQLTLKIRRKNIAKARLAIQF